MERDTETEAPGNPNVSEVSEQLRGDFEMLRQAVTEKTDQIRNTVGTFVDEHPIAAVGAAFGIGYLLSGALYSKTTGRLLGFGTRFLVGALLKQAVAGGGLGLLASLAGDPQGQSSENR